MADGLDFSPLSDAEREAAAHQLERDGAPDEAKPICAPADAESPEVAAARLFGRTPDAHWRYADAAGALAFCVCRWNKPDGEKEIRPLSWFDGEGWRFAHWPDARPLYNLEKLAAQPDAPIVICEGEKAADAAVRIFPRSIATTSSGGAKAFAKTDWKPGAGRRVLFWPDNDEPGEAYARNVAAILADLGCEVSIIDAAALVTQIKTPNPDGFDAADALNEMPFLSAIRKLAASLAKLFDPGPDYLSFGPYKMDRDGLKMEKETGRGEARKTEFVWIAAPFEIIGACRDAHGGGWGKLLHWQDGDRRQHVQHVAEAALHGEPAALCAQLADLGLRIARTRQRDFAGYLSAANVRRRVRLVSRTGWHEIEGRRVFVLPGQTIGPAGGERVILDAAAHGPYEARGTIEDWRDGVARLASGHALPVLAISAALAGPLLDLAGIEGGGLHFHGHSSKGKTTLLQLAASVWGRGDGGGYVRTWRATANGLGGAAAGGTDTGLILDEVGQVDARDMAAALYSLANGTGKARAARDGGLREPKTWRVLTISSGEVPVDGKLSEDRGRKTRAGQLVRLLDIPAQRAHGVFDHSGPSGNAADLAKAFKQSATSAYGTAGPEFVRRLIGEPVAGDDVRAFVASFLRAHVPAGADGQIDRAAHRLGLIAAAGELATDFGLTDWRAGEATEAAAWALAQWIDGRGGTEPAEVSQAIATVRRFIEAHGEARFDNLDDSEARAVNNRAGWRKGSGEDRRWLIPTETWKLEVCAGLDANFVASVLGERGMLERSGDGLQKTMRIEGRLQRVRAVTPRTLDGGEA
jgi:putative DNA primase/helicase